jgi:hypothetical protein
MAPGLQVRSIGRLYRDCRKAISPPFQINCRDERFLPDLADRNFAACDQLIKFRFADRRQPAALGNSVEQLIHVNLVIRRRDSPGDLTRERAGDGERASTVAFRSRRVRQLIFV